MPCKHASSMLMWFNAGALNWATGETVAVKEIQLSNIPKAELGEIMVCGGWFISRSMSSEATV